jgi:hypothetical protein
VRALLRLSLIVIFIASVYQKEAFCFVIFPAYTCLVSYSKCTSVVHNQPKESVFVIGHYNFLQNTSYWAALWLPIPRSPFCRDKRKQKFIFISRDNYTGRQNNMCILHARGHVWVSISIHAKSDAEIFDNSRRFPIVAYSIKDSLPRDLCQPRIDNQSATTRHQDVRALGRWQYIGASLRGVSGAPEMHTLIYTGSDENYRRHNQSAGKQRQLPRIYGEPTSIVVTLTALLLWCCCAGITCVVFSAGFSAFAAGEPFMGLLLFAEGALLFIGAAILAAKWI